MLQNLENCVVKKEENEILRFIRQNFVDSEITRIEWTILEDFVNLSQPCRLFDILTIQICERIEEDKENEIFMKVNRFVELNPFTRQLKLKKTVKPIPFYEELAKHKKPHRFITKL